MGWYVKNCAARGPPGRHPPKAGVQRPACCFKVPHVLVIITWIVILLPKHRNVFFLLLYGMGNDPDTRWLLYIFYLFPIHLRPRFLPSSFFFFFNKWLFLNINLFIYFWLHRIFVTARGLSLVVVSGGYSSLQCAGFSLWWLLLLQSMGSRRTGFSSCGTRA